MYTDYNKFSTRIQVLEVVNSGVDQEHGPFADVLINGEGKEDGSPYRLSQDALDRSTPAAEFSTELELTSTEMSGILNEAIKSNVAFYSRFYKSYKPSDAAASFSDVVSEKSDEDILKFVKTKKHISSFFRNNTQYGELREGVFVNPNEEMKEVSKKRLREERYTAMKTLWDDPNRWAVVKEDEGFTIYVKHKNGRKAMVHPHFYDSEEKAEKVKDLILTWINEVSMEDSTTENPRHLEIKSSGVVALETYYYPNNNTASARNSQIQGRATVWDLSKPMHQAVTQIVTSNLIEIIWNGVRYVNKSLIGTVPND